MVNWISVLTCAGRDKYLGATIANIDRAGGAVFVGRKVIFVGGPTSAIDGRFPGWEVESISEEVRGGVLFAMVDVYRRAATANVDTLLYFEDDIELALGTIPAMLEIGIPESLGFVSYCDLAWITRERQRLEAFPACAKNEIPAATGYQGCQAMAIANRTLRKFLTWERPAWLAMSKHDADSTMGMIADYGVFDSLVNHVGRTSAILQVDYDRLKGVRGFVGVDFDASSVPRTWTLNPLGRRCVFHAQVLHADKVPCPHMPDVDLHEPLVAGP